MLRTPVRIVAALLVPILLADCVLGACCINRSPLAISPAIALRPTVIPSFAEQALSTRVGAIPELEPRDFASRLRRMAAAIWRAIPVSQTAMYSFPALPSSTDGKKHRPVILIAEDDEDSREDIGLLLTKDGKLNDTHEIISAVDGAKALARFKDLKDAGRQIDLLISDMEMPEMDGNQLVAAVLAMQPGISIVFETAMPGKVDAAIRTLPNVQVLHKLDIFDKLVGVVRAALPTDQSMNPQLAKLDKDVILSVSNSDQEDWQSLLLAPLDLALPQRAEDSESSRGSSGGKPEFAIHQLFALAKDLGIQVAGKTVLSLGLGHTSREVEAISNEALSLGRIIGVEIIGEYVRQIAERIFHSVPNLKSTLKLYHADARSIPKVANDSVAVVSAIGLVPPDGAPTAIAEMIRVLEPGGLAHVMLDLQELSQTKLTEEIYAIERMLKSSGELHLFFGGSLTHFIFQKKLQRAENPSAPRDMETAA